MSLELRASKEEQHLCDFLEIDIAEFMRQENMAQHTRADILLKDVVELVGDLRAG